MAVPWIRSSQFLRALVLTTWVASFLAWLYVTLRIVINGINPPEPFFPGVRSFSFIEAGAFSFALFCVSMFLYLWIWGWFRERPVPIPYPPPPQR